MPSARGRRSPLEDGARAPQWAVDVVESAESSTLNYLSYLIRVLQWTLERVRQVRARRVHTAWLAARESSWWRTKGEEDDLDPDL